MDEVHKNGVKLLRVCDGMYPGGADLAGYDAPWTDLSCIAALSGGAANIQHDSVLLRYQPDALV